MDSSKSLIYQVMANQFEPDSSWITVMCRASRFQIAVSLKDLRGSPFELEYSQLVATAEDLDGGGHDAYEALCDWIVNP